MLQEPVSKHFERASLRSPVETELRAALPHIGQVFFDLEKSGAYPGVTLLPLPEEGCRRCAVLLLVYLRDGSPYILAQERAHNLNDFPGAIVFPGGGIEGSESGRDAALRECKEEVGADVPIEAVLGCFPPISKAYQNGRAFEVVTALAFMERLPDLHLDPKEVARIIELPLFPPSDPNVAPELMQLGGLTRFIYDGLNLALERTRGLPSPLTMAVSFGRTQVPIDMVRNLSNDSRGTSGALISEAALRRGHLVHCLFGKDARTPFKPELTFDQNAEDRAAEMRRVARDAARVTPYLQRAVFDPVPTFDAYRKRILQLAEQADYDVVIASMAASDFGPKAVDGKISSNQAKLLIECEPLPKIISLIKKQRSDLFLVGFKLLINKPPDVLIEKAYANLLRDRQDLAVANVGKDSMKPLNMLTYILTAERGVIPVERNALPETLLRLIEERYSKRYYSTSMTKVAKLPLSEEEVEKFCTDCRRLARLALFNPYLKGHREEFGFLAKRTEAGTLITGRGSSKTEATVDDVGIVTGLDHEALTLSVTSTGKKASLNASLAHQIFEARPEVQYILHAHIPLPEAVSVGRDTSPATAEDWECAAPLVRAGHSVIWQPNHGVLVLLKELDEIFPILARNSVYRSHADHYDTAYHRFIANPRLADLFRSLVPVDGRVLDLAGGTGEVTRQLLERGYHDITLADISDPMLKVARAKLGHVIPDSKFVNSAMQDLPFVESFDGIIVRQAINYLSEEDLVQAFKGMYRSLRQGGRLVFNSFDAAAARDRTSRFVREETGNQILITTEGNLVDGVRLFHGQRTEMFDALSGEYRLIYDLNSFWIHTTAQFEKALHAAGFAEVITSSEKNSLYFVARK